MTTLASSSRRAEVATVARPAPARSDSPSRAWDASRSRHRASFPAASVAGRVSTLLPPRVRGDAASPAPTLWGAGEPLPGEVRARLEASLRADLGAVRVHPAHAAEPAPGPGVRAFAYGDHVVLGSGERATDLGLMAHEAAHVLQQRGDAAVPQTSAADASGALEHEADRVSAAVVAGERTRVQGRTAPRPQFQLGWLRRAAGAVAGAVGDVAGAALRFIRDRAVHIPGYSLFAFVIGRDPITQQPVERSAANLVRGLMGLWPGGELVFQALQRYGILDRVGGWLRAQLDTLRGIVSGIRTGLDRFIATLGPADILSPGAVFDRARRIFADPAERAVAFVRGLAGDVLGFIRDAVLRPIARLAEGTRGYDLLKLVLGQDPIIGDPYPRTAANVIGGFMRLIGQEEKWRHLQESRAVPRAWAWFQQQLGTLLGFVREVPALFVRVWRSLQIRDLLDLPGAFARMRGIFGGFVTRFVSWAGDAALQVMMFILEALAPRAMPVLRRAASVIRTIVAAPVAFVGNLVRAGLRGFQQFRENIRTHLINGLVGWLTGALAGAGLQLPARWDARGILSLALQVLGLTWQNIRQKLLRHIPEPVLRGLEATFGLVATLVREGPAAAWRQILEHLQNLREMVFGQIREWVTRTVVGQAVVRILSMLNPAGAVIQAIIAIYNTIMFFRERLQQIAQVAEAFFNSIAAIAAGNIGAAATRVEQTMGRLVPVVISFLARLIGLGGISDTIRNIVASIRAPVDRALDRVVDWLAAQARRLGRAVMGGRQDQGRSGDTPLRREVRSVLMRELSGDVSVEQVRTTVQRVFRQFASRGVRRIGLSEPDRAGNRQILVEASPYTPEVLLELAQVREAVSLAATVTFYTPQSIELTTRPTRVADPNVSGNVLFASHQAGFTAVSPVSRPGSAGPQRETISSDTFQATAYNIPGHGHAEENFVRWITQTFPGGLAHVRSIEITLTHSPCRVCSREVLNQFRNRLTVVPGRPAPTLRLHYRRPHTTGPDPTTVEDLAVLASGSRPFQITADRAVTLTNAERDRRAADRVRARMVRG